jgi:hypothetical protein
LAQGNFEEYVDLNKKVDLVLVYPMTTGRNFDEVLRVIDSLQMTAKHKVATHVNWKQGEDVIIACGTRRLSRELLASGEAVRVNGVDPVADYVAFARTHQARVLNSQLLQVMRWHLLAGPSTQLLPFSSSKMSPIRNVPPPKWLGSRVVAGQ